MIYLRKANDQLVSHCKCSDAPISAPMQMNGYFVPIDAEGIKFEGFHSLHYLAVVPQVEALTDPAIVDSLLGNRQYWHDTALPDCAQ